jgi:protein TonB
MKNILVSIFCLLTSVAFGQDTTFFDHDWNKVESITSAAYFRVVLKDTLESSRATETIYFNSGQIYTRKNYSVYKDRKLDGKLNEWYESGQIRKNIDYKDGKKNGQLFTYWDNGKLKRADNYINDTLIRGRCINPDGSQATFHDYERLPEFPGGIDRLVHYLRKEIKYPKNSIRIGTEGRVLVQFIVNRNGAISGVKIIQSISHELDQEAKRVVSNMPKWEPGMEDGEAVRAFFTLPIEFRLSNKAGRL